jgi:GT2 family glycosyltransferase
MFDMKDPILGIMILNKNGRKWLSRLYDSLFADGYVNKRVYLVDNASDDGSVELTLEHYPEVIIIRMRQNLGYSMAYNLAMPYAFHEGCEWLIWSNNDIFIEAGSLAKLVCAAQIDKDIGILGPALFSWDSDEPHPFMVGNYPHALAAVRSQAKTPVEVDWVEGSFPMINRRCIEDVGPLDPYLYLGWEDADFCRRARYHGWRVVLVPNAIVHHYGGGWTYADTKSRLEHYQFRTRNYYIYKLTNPFQGFLKNIIDAIHIFLFKVKITFRSRPSSISLEMKMLVQVVRDIGIIHKKWCRDAALQPPLSLAPETQIVEPERITSPLAKDKFK